MWNSAHTRDNYQTDFSGFSRHVFTSECGVTLIEPNQSRLTGRTLGFNKKHFSNSTINQKLNSYISLFDGGLVELSV